MLREMGLIQLYSTPKTNTVADRLSTMASQCPEYNFTFCNCSQRTDRRPQQQSQSLEKTQPKCPLNLSSAHLIPKPFLEPSKHDKSHHQPIDTCRCGEDACQTINWSWDQKFVQPQTILDNHTVLFHPYYSQGTSIVRSSEPLAMNMIHYWEIKIVHWFSGTDLVSSINK